MVLSVKTTAEKLTKPRVRWYSEKKCRLPQGIDGNRKPTGKEAPIVMLKAVIFDFDGTIADTVPLCIAACRAAFEPLAGRKFSDEEIVATFGPSEEGSVRALIPDHYEAGLAAYLACYKKLHALCPKPFDGIPPLLRRLKSKGLVVGLVTGKGRRSCDISLEAYGLAGAFDAVETGSPDGPCKPKGIAAILNRFGLDGREALYTGDVPSDIAASRQAGVRIASAAWATTADPEALAAHAPDAVCESLEAFDRYIEDLLLEN